MATGRSVPRVGMTRISNIRTSVPLCHCSGSNAAAENTEKETAIHDQQALCEATVSQWSSFQTAQFEHVWNKDLGVPPASPACIHNFFQATARLNWAMGYEIPDIGRYLTSLCFSSIFSQLWRLFLSQPVGQSPYHREYRYFQGLISFPCAGVPQHTHSEYCSYCWLP